MSSLLQEKISQMIGSYSRMNGKGNKQKFVQDLIALLLGEKMDKINLGSSLSMIQEELMKQQKDKQISSRTTDSLMEEIKTNMSNVLTNAIMNRIK